MVFRDLRFFRFGDPHGLKRVAEDSNIAQVNQRGYTPLIDA